MDNLAGSLRYLVGLTDVRIGKYEIRTLHQLHQSKYLNLKELQYDYVGSIDICLLHATLQLDFSWMAVSVGGSRETRPAYVLTYSRLA